MPPKPCSEEWVIACLISEYASRTFRVFSVSFSCAIEGHPPNIYLILLVKYDLLRRLVHKDTFFQKKPKSEGTG
jgi:hypothetical protein